MGNEFVKNTRYFKGYVVVVEMNLVAYSRRDYRDSHVPVACDLSGVIRVKLQVIFDFGNVHFVILSHKVTLSRLQGNDGEILPPARRPLLRRVFLRADE